MWIWIISFNSNAQRSLRKKQGLQGLKMLDDSRETILGRTKRLPLWNKAVVTASTRLQQSQDRKNLNTERRGAIPRWEAVGN